MLACDLLYYRSVRINFEKIKCQNNDNIKFVNVASINIGTYKIIVDVYALDSDEVLYIINDAHN
jgi:hypothetical protein